MNNNRFNISIVLEIIIMKPTRVSAEPRRDAKVRRTIGGGVRVRVRVKMGLKQGESGPQWGQIVCCR